LQITGLRACYAQGVVDDQTLVWGQGLTGWYPIRNVIGLTANIRNLESESNQSELVYLDVGLTPHSHCQPSL
jgi:GYF domain 2